MPARILVVDDDPDILEVTGFAVEKAGFETLFASDGLAAINAQQQEDPDLIVLDIGLPEMDGLEVCREIRKISEVPILFLTARDEEIDRILGLELGADDYLTKPFEFEELLARVRSLLRRKGEIRPSTLRSGDLELDQVTHRVTRAGRLIELTSKEYALLEYLMLHAGQVVTRTMLLENVWDYHFDPQTNVIDVHISRLRGKIDKDFDRPLLHTVRGAGYRLQA